MISSADSDALASLTVTVQNNTLSPRPCTDPGRGPPHSMSGLALGMITEKHAHTAEPVQARSLQLRAMVMDDCARILPGEPVGEDIITASREGQSGPLRLRLVWIDSGAGWIGAWR